MTLQWTGQAGIIRDDERYPLSRAPMSSLWTVMFARANRVYDRILHRPERAGGMAKEITLMHPSGLHETAYVGFSWTSLFFGAFPAIFRGDWLAFCVYLVLCIVGSVATWGIGTLVLWLVWPFFYNRWHARRLIEKGYQITGAGIPLDEAKARVLG
jgi:hypothetical protein